MSAANTARNERERYIVAKLIAHLGAHGWSPYVNDDGGEHVYCPTPERALASVFSVDESRLHFAPAALVAEVEKYAGAQRRRARKACDAACHAVLLICGNDVDIISDWSYGDTDNFGAAMQAFADPEELVAQRVPELLAERAGLLAILQKCEKELSDFYDGMPPEHWLLPELRAVIAKVQS